MKLGHGGLANRCAGKFEQLDVITNNIANVGTPGFKAGHLYQGEKAPHNPEAPAGTTYIFVDYSQGILQRTDNALDVALQGDGFFVVETKTGLAYTRKGNFTINKDGQLVTRSRDYVLGEAGPIKISGQRVDIDHNGTIMVDGTQAGRLRIVDFKNRQGLARGGDGLLIDNGDAGITKVEKPNINPGYLELANVNLIDEMVRMIDIQRSFESYHKAMQMTMEMDKLAVSRIGRLA